MNDEIKELMVRATIHTINGSNPDGDVDKMYIPAEFVKYFSEMLVKECAQICYRHSESAGGEETTMGYAYRDCGDDIKKTFGVK
jgi:hypothetical protein